MHSYFLYFFFFFVSGTIHSIDYSNDGKMMVTASDDDSINLYDCEEGTWVYLTCLYRSCKLRPYFVFCLLSPCRAVWAGVCLYRAPVSIWITLVPFFLLFFVWLISFQSHADVAFEKVWGRTHQVHTWGSNRVAFFTKGKRWPTSLVI